MTPTGSDLPEPERPAAIGSWLFGLETDDVERAHVVVTLDTRTGDASISGPYRTALAALCAADVEYQVDRDQGGHGELTFHVAALQAPIGSEDLDPVVDPGAPPVPVEHDVRRLAHAIAGLTAGAERAIRRRARLAAGTLVVTAAPWLPDVGDVWPRRGRAPRHRHLHGRDAR